MARYLVSCEHTPEECVTELDSIMAFSHQLLDRIDWGCKDGEHVGWFVVEAQDAATARMFLPTNIRAKAKVRRVVKFSVEDIQAMHEPVEPPTP
jgi:hypothetical protein